MISYIIALIAAAIFLINPLAQIIFSSGKGPQAVERPHLNSSLLAIEEVNATAPECGNVGYNVRILRREPLIVYLEGFLSDEERSHLLKIRCVRILRVICVCVHVICSTVIYTHMHTHLRSHTLSLIYIMDMHSNV